MGNALGICLGIRKEDASQDEDLDWATSPIWHDNLRKQERSPEDDSGSESPEVIFGEAAHRKTVIPTLILVDPRSPTQEILRTPITIGDDGPVLKKTSNVEHLRKNLVLQVNQAMNQVNIERASVLTTPVGNLDAGTSRAFDSSEPLTEDLDRASDVAAVSSENTFRINPSVFDVSNSI